MTGQRLRPRRREARLTKIPDAVKGPSLKELTAKENMVRQNRTNKGKAKYARRNVIIEPVFGQIKQGLGFRSFLMRGLGKTKGGMGSGLPDTQLIDLVQEPCVRCLVNRRSKGRLREISLKAEPWKPSNHPILRDLRAKASGTQILSNSP